AVPRHIHNTGGRGSTMGRCLVPGWTWAYLSAQDEWPGLGAVTRLGHGHPRGQQRRLWAPRPGAPDRWLRADDQGLLAAEPARGARPRRGAAALDPAPRPDPQRR